MKELGCLILVLIVFAAGLFAGLYLADQSPADLVKLVEEKTQLEKKTLGVNVTFADENLEAAIREILSKPPGEAITSADLTRILSLNASRRGITDLSGIEYCSSLTLLYLMSNQISDISQLSSLTNLFQLNLRDNKIKDLSPLVENSGLGEGDWVWLENNNLDLSEGSKDLVSIRELRERGVTVMVAPKPAEFKVSAINISPVKVVVGDRVAVEADVANVGEAVGTYDAILTVNGKEAGTNKVTLGGGEKRTVSFAVVKDTSGTYNVAVGGLSGEFTVLGLAKFKCDTYGYSLSYPEGWEIDTADLTDVSIEAGVNFIGIMVDDVSAELSLSEACAQFISEAEEELLGFELISSEQAGEREGIPCQELVFDVTQEGVKIKSKALIAVSGKLGFTVLCMTPEDRWEESTSVFDAVLRSFLPPKTDFVKIIPVPPAGYKGYVDWENGYFVAYPEGWQQAEIAFAAAYFVGPAEEGPPTFTIVKEPIPVEMTAREYFEDAKKLYGMFAGYKVVSTEEVMINDVPAVKHVLTHKVAAGDTEIIVKQMQICLTKGRTAFVMSCGSRLEFYDKHEETFDTIVGSFTFIQ